MFERFGYESVPSHLLDGLVMYGKKYVPTGGFLRAVLNNDLMDASVRADPESRKSIGMLALFIHYEMPVNCHGSPEKVMAWLDLREDE